MKAEGKVADGAVPGDLLARAVAHYEGKAAEKVEIPEWGATVYVRQLSLASRVELDSEDDISRRIALTVIKCARDEKGEPLFKNTGETIAMLEGKVDPNILLRISSKARGRDLVEIKNDSEETE